MTTATKKFQRKLTKAEMAKILTAIDEADSGLNALIAGLVAFYDTALRQVEGRGWEEFQNDPEATLTPWEYAIPEAQWGEIATAISDKEKSFGAVASVNRMLDWMNKGPSAYDPEQ